MIVWWWWLQTAAGRWRRALRRWPRRFTARHHLNIAAEYDRMADDAEAGGQRYTARLLRELATERRKQAGWRPPRGS